MLEVMLHSLGVSQVYDTNGELTAEADKARRQVIDIAQFLEVMGLIEIYPKSLEDAIDEIVNEK